jgi:hypothetical protein
MIELVVNEIVRSPKEQEQDASVKLRCKHYAVDSTKCEFHVGFRERFRERFGESSRQSGL